MATDIWIHIEYKSKRTHEWTYAYEAQGDREYIMFGVLAFYPIYEPRGLPNDISSESLKDFESWGEDAHTPCWLTTTELRECLDEAHKRYISEGYISSQKWLASYEEIYQNMKKKEDDGEPARMVFWFDN